MVLPLVRAMAAQEDLRLSVATLGGCPGSATCTRQRFALTGSPVSNEDCERFKEDLYDRVVPALQPDIVLAMNFDYEAGDQFVQYLNDDGDPMSARDPQFEEQLLGKTTSAAAQLTEGGADLVVLEPIPRDAGR